MQETWVQSLGWEDPLEEGWQPTPVFLPEKSHGQRSLSGYSSLGHRVRHNWIGWTNRHVQFSSVTQHVPILISCVIYSNISLSLSLCFSLSHSPMLLAVFFLLMYEFGCMCVYSFFPETLEHNLVNIPFYGTRAFCYISIIQWLKLGTVTLYNTII